jgi:hypothetical protein
MPADHRPFAPWVPSEPSRPMRPQGKPCNWWALESKPWERIGAGLQEREARDEAQARCARATATAFAVLGDRLLSIAPPIAPITLGDE